MAAPLDQQPRAERARREWGDPLGPPAWAAVGAVGLPPGEAPAQAALLAPRVVRGRGATPRVAWEREAAPRVADQRVLRAAAAPRAALVWEREATPRVAEQRALRAAMEQGDALGARVAPVPEGSVANPHREDRAPGARLGPAAQL